MLNMAKRLTINEIDLIGSYMWKILFYCKKKDLGEEEKEEEINRLLEEARKDSIILEVDRNKCEVYFPLSR